MRGGIDTVTAPVVPALLPVGLLLRIAFTRAECGRPHRVEVILQGEDGDRLMEASAVLTPEWKEDLPPHWRVGILSALNFPIPLPRYGLYSFEILINDTSHKTIPLRVIQPLSASGG
jgi:hypothetical protein